MATSRTFSRGSRVACGSCFSRGRSAWPAAEAAGGDSSAPSSGSLPFSTPRHLRCKKSHFSTRTVPFATTSVPAAPRAARPKTKPAETKDLPRSRTRARSGPDRLKADHIGLARRLKDFPAALEARPQHEAVARPDGARAAAVLLESPKRPTGCGRTPTRRRRSAICPASLPRCRRRGRPASSTFQVVNRGSPEITRPAGGAPPSGSMPAMPIRDEGRRPGHDLLQRLLEIGDDVVRRPRCRPTADHVRAGAGGDLLLVGQLAVRGRGRVDDQRAGVAEIGEMREQLQRLHQPDAGLDSRP